MAAPNNELLSKVGLDTVTDEEHEDLTSTLSALADADLADATGTMSNNPNSDSGDSADNIFYVNFKPDTQALSQSMLAELDNITKNVNLNSGFVSVKARQATADKIAEGEIDRNNRNRQSNYTAKVVSHLFQNAPWISMNNIQTNVKRFEVKKNEFHGDLVLNFTEGLRLPVAIANKLEDFLTNVKNLINNSSQTSEPIHVVICITVYQKDDIVETWHPFVRTIYFKPTKALTNYAQKKDDVGQSDNVDVNFEDVQMDAMFNNRLFEKAARPAIANLLNQVGYESTNPKTTYNVLF